MGKISFVAGAAAGYVLGTRAGRRRYEQIRSGAAKVWTSEPVQRRVGSAQARVTESARAAAPAAAAKLLDVASSAAKKAAQSAKAGGAKGRAASPATAIDEARD